MFEEDMPEDKIIGWLEDEGALTIEGIDEDGELVLKMIPEKMKEVFPELYESLSEEINEALLELYDAGYIDISYNEELKPVFSINESGKKILNKYGYGDETKND